MIEIIQDISSPILQFVLFLGLALIVVLFVMTALLFAVMLFVFILDILIFLKNLPRKIYERYILFSKKDFYVIFNKFSIKLIIEKAELKFIKIKKSKVKSINVNSTFTREKTIFSIKL
jgi:hypothetical protein